MKAKREGKVEGVNVSSEEEVTHTLFVDDVLLFGGGIEENVKVFAYLIEKYKRATGMLVNIEKSMIVHNGFSKEILQQSKQILSYPSTNFSDGFKYLGFFLKPNNYGFQDWI